MIQIPEPAIALNDMRVGGHIKMSRSLRIHKSDSRENIIGAITNLASAQPNGRLKSLVLNSHGLPGYLHMGQGFWQPHASMFQSLEGKVATIWITACRIASRDPFGEAVPASLKPKVGDGFLFCQQIAVNAKCHVVASLNTQWVPSLAIPMGCVDNFEGRLLCWKPDGSIAWTGQYSMRSVE